MVRQNILSEIIIKTFTDRRVFPQPGAVFDTTAEVIINSTEAEPLNVIDEGLLVAEMIASVHVKPYEGEEYNMTQDQIDDLFDKDRTTYIPFNVGDEWLFTLKIPFGIKELYILDTDGFAIPFYWGWYDIEGNLHDYDLESPPYGQLVLDEKIMGFKIKYEVQV